MKREYIVGVTYVEPADPVEGQTPVRLFLGDTRKWSEVFEVQNKIFGSQEVYLWVKTYNDKVTSCRLISQEFKPYSGGVLDRFLDAHVMQSIFDVSNPHVGGMITAGNIWDDMFWKWLPDKKATPGPVDNGDKKKPNSGSEASSETTDAPSIQVATTAIVDDRVEYKPLDIGIEGLIGDASAIVDGGMIQRIMIGSYDDDPTLDGLSELRVVAAAVCHARTGGPSVGGEALFIMLEDGKMYYLDSKHPLRPRLWIQAIAKDEQSISAGTSWRDTDYQGFGALIR